MRHALIGVFVALGLAGLAHADTSSKGQGLVPEGTAPASSVNPMVGGGKDTNGKVRTFLLLPDGSVSMVPSGTFGATVFAVKSGTVTTVNLIADPTTGELRVSQGIDPIGDAILPTTESFASAGGSFTVTPGVSSKVVYVCKAVIQNIDSVLHKVQITRDDDSVSLASAYLSPQTTTVGGGSWTIDDVGFYQSHPSHTLKITCDANGSGSSQALMITMSFAQK